MEKKSDHEEPSERKRKFTKSPSAPDHPRHTRRNSLPNPSALAEAPSQTSHKLDVGKGKIIDLEFVIQKTLIKQEVVETIVPVWAASLLPTIQDVIAETVKKSLSEFVGPLKATIDLQNKKIDELETTNQLLNDKCSELQDQIDDIQTVFRSTNLELDDKIDELEQYSRRESLRFHNITVPEDEINNTDAKIISLCANKLDIQLGKDDISRSHIVGKPDENGTVVINISSAELKKIGVPDLETWLKNPKNVYIGRNLNFIVKGASESKWQNPYSIKRFGREKCIQLYEKHVRDSPHLYNSLKELRGKCLGCWCYPKLCHGHVLVRLLSEQLHNTLNKS